MADRAEVLVFQCSQQDLRELLDASGPDGPSVKEVNTREELLHGAITEGPVGLVLGVGMETLSRLEMIPIVRSARQNIPVIVIGENDSLELERRSREKEIFLYLVHPIDAAEARAALQDVMRRAGRKQ